MKTDALRQLRQKLAADVPVHGLWITLESASITEMAVALGLDWVVIDAEHGHLDWREILDHLRVTVRSQTVALVRIAELNIGLIKRALDIGADGVIVPWVESAEQFEQAVAFAHYPPDGLRGIGAERATCWGRCFTAHVEEADEHVMVIPIVETVRGGKNVGQICQVPGLDVVFIGPADYSSTAGFAGQWEGPGVADALVAIQQTVRSYGKKCGVVATSNENIIQRQQQGFRMIGLGLDSGLLLRSLSGAIATVDRDRRILPSFVPDSATSHPVSASPASPVPLNEPPSQIRPDRPEVVTTFQDAKQLELESGVRLRMMVGAHNQARNLTTGIVEFQPRTHLPYHTHPHGESVTVLEGEMAFEVCGRRYHLRPLDNIWIPPGTAHFAANLSTNQKVVAHVAMDTDSPSRELVENTYRLLMMPDAATGFPNAEHVSRHATTAWYEPNPGANFQDFFNEDLGSPRLSGGYGIFEPGARLPCHLHDFDESITIIEGEADCIVEGREYRVSSLTTALAPRGRCHYFVNRSQAPMAMIWVYAGGIPQRIVLNERCCTKAGCGRA